MMAKRRSYPSDISTARWHTISALLKNEPRQSPAGRKRSTDLREVINAINYRWTTGCTWRMLPHDYPPWRTVYHYFHHWRSSGELMQIREVILRTSPYVPLDNDRYARELQKCSPHRKQERVRNEVGQMAQDRTDPASPGTELTCL